jgi:hypothetical protein
MIRFALLLATALTACSPAPAPPAAPIPAPAPDVTKPASLDELKQAHDWQHEPGEKLNAAWNDGAVALLGKLSRPDAITVIQAAGFECIYGEAHEDYPDPAAQCTRSFATRSCQMDWEIFSTAAKGMVDEVDGSFKRDCVGTDDDWPDKVVSDIDKQLAPVTPPPPQ